MCKGAESGVIKGASEQAEGGRREERGSQVVPESAGFFFPTDEILKERTQKALF